MDKGDVVRAAATAATKAILKLFPPESTRIVFDTLEGILETGKWRTKVGVLDAFKSFVAPARDAVASQLGDLLPKVEHAMHDTKTEVSHQTNFSCYLFLLTGVRFLLLLSRVLLPSVQHLRILILLPIYLSLSNVWQILIPFLPVSKHFRQQLSLQRLKRQRLPCLYLS